MRIHHAPNQKARFYPNFCTGKIRAERNFVCVEKIQPARITAGKNANFGGNNHRCGATFGGSVKVWVFARELRFVSSLRARKMWFVHLSFARRSASSTGLQFFPAAANFVRATPTKPHFLRQRGYNQNRPTKRALDLWVRCGFWSIISVPKFFLPVERVSVPPTSQ